MLKGPVEYVPQFGRKFVGQTRLHEERGAALTVGAFTQLRFRVAGEQDDRNVSSSRFVFEILNELSSITAGQGQVRNDNVRTRFPGPATGLRTVSRCNRLETQSGKARNVQFTGVVVVVDDEYQGPRRNVARATPVHGRESGAFPASRLRSGPTLVC
jgi:hypothetical protein